MSTESLTSRPPLPPHWVSKIFRECQGHYGSRWLDMWRTGQTLPDGTDVGLQNAMEKWGERLAGFIDRPEALRKAMQSLPIHPPTLPEFIALCRQQSITLQDSLPPPTPDADKRMRNIEQATAVKVGTNGGKAWAERLRTRYLAGERLLPIQVQLASEALEEVWEGGAVKGRAPARFGEVEA